MKWISLLIPIGCGVTSFLWMPMKVWGSLDDGLLIFLGLLVAALVQVIPVTANFLQADELTPDEAIRLTRALENQQKYWLGLLGVAVGTAILLVIGKAIEGHLTFGLPYFGQTGFEQLFSGLIGFSASLIAVKTFGFFPGVQSLQKLRSELVIAAAKRRAAEQIAKATKERAITGQIVPEDYGRAIHPH